MTPPGYRLLAVPVVAEVVAKVVVPAPVLVEQPKVLRRCVQPKHCSEPCRPLKDTLQVMV